jgi:uncharacterized protein YjcR
MNIHEWRKKYSKLNEIITMRTIAEKLGVPANSLSMKVRNGWGLEDKKRPKLVKMESESCKQQ